MPNRTTLVLAAAVSALALGALGSAKAADMYAPPGQYEPPPQNYAPPQQGYYPPPPQNYAPPEGYAYSPPLPFPQEGYAYPPPATVPYVYPEEVYVGLLRPYYGPGPYWRGYYGPRVVYGYGRWGHGYRRW
jgi:hypothetical protein